MTWKELNEEVVKARQSLPRRRPGSGVPGAIAPALDEIFHWHKHGEWRDMDGDRYEVVEVRLRFAHAFTAAMAESISYDGALFSLIEINADDEDPTLLYSWLYDDLYSAMQRSGLRGDGPHRN
jgi:hypothetical protein